MATTTLAEVTAELAELEDPKARDGSPTRIPWSRVPAGR